MIAKLEDLIQMDRFFSSHILLKKAGKNISPHKVVYIVSLYENMQFFIIVLKLFVGLSILNVWLVRFTKPTQWRGGNAQNMKEEYASYGLPNWSVYVIGGSKVLLALLLIISIWAPSLQKFSAYGIAFFMAGAVLMHVKIKDPLKKSLPAFTFLILSMIIGCYG